MDKYGVYLKELKVDISMKIYALKNAFWNTDQHKNIQYLQNVYKNMYKILK